jgi:transcriptional/translational regulatory protein YebC/TACO1
VQDALLACELDFESAEMTMLSSTDVEIDLSDAQTLLNLIDHMEDLDDIQNVFSNANISDRIASDLEAE